MGSHIAGVFFVSSYSGSCFTRRGVSKLFVVVFEFALTGALRALYLALFVACRVTRRLDYRANFIVNACAFAH